MTWAVCGAMSNNELEFLFYKLIYSTSALLGTAQSAGCLW